MDDRKNVKISGPAASVLDRLVDDYAAKQAVVVERLLEWLGSQSDAFQDAIIRRKGDPAAVLLREKMAELAAGVEISGMSIDEALNAVRLLLDRIETVSAAHQEQLGIKQVKGKPGGKGK